MSATVLTPLAPADLDAVEVLERDLFGVSAWSRESLASELAGPGRTYLAARDAAGAVLGYAGLWFDGEDAQVMTLATARGQQGRGIGRALLDALVARAREIGAHRVYLEVRVDNEPAIHLYETTGFARVGRRRRYYQPEDVDAWTMLLELVEPAG